MARALTCPVCGYPTSPEAIDVVHVFLGPEPWNAWRELLCLACGGWARAMMRQPRGCAVCSSPKLSEETFMGELLCYPCAWWTRCALHLL